jgi:RimJ/RimL family protein N-acetyltransferase
VSSNAVLPIRTPRLILDRLAADDLPELGNYRSDPEVARYQSWEHWTLDDGRRLLQSQEGLSPGTPGAWFQFAVRLEAGGELIGDCGLWVDAEDPRLGEIGFTFGRRHQGQGLASEATEAVLRFAFDGLQLHRVKAVVDCRNLPAVRLLERLGLRREGHHLQHAWFKGAWCDEYAYAALRAEWQEKHPPP